MSSITENGKFIKLNEILAFSGVEVKNVLVPTVDTRGLKDYLKKQVEEAAKAVINNVSWNSNISYGKFFRSVEKNIDGIVGPKQLPMHLRIAVSLKLSELAKKRIEKKESNFSAVRRFFHRIAQLFKGHGFRTKGEWGLKLSAKIENVKNKEYKKILESIFSEKAKENTIPMESKELNKSEINKAIAEELNNLEKDKFISFLNEVVWEKHAGAAIYANKDGPWRYPLPGSLFRPGFLNQEKKEIMEEEILKKDDWVGFIYDNVIHLSEEIKNFVERMKICLTPKLLDKLLQNSSLLYNTNRLHPNFYRICSELMIQRLLKQGDTGSFLKIRDLIKKHWDKVEIRKILEEKRVLNKEERDLLNDKIDPDKLDPKNEDL